ncbi:MAG: hypothetical protein FWG56_12130 [Desulfovibrionaceae bacterium]|nr:hypothetical protein [Desulfovibrionaceae bacterium]
MLEANALHTVSGRRMKSQCVRSITRNCGELKARKHHQKIVNIGMRAIELLGNRQARRGQTPVVVTGEFDDAGVVFIADEAGHARLFIRRVFYDCRRRFLLRRRDCVLRGIRKQSHDEQSADGA